jgi:citrate lyase subunit beta / citryl-CoA lyase
MFRPDRPDRFDKAAAAGTDAVILDLEDAVAPEAKAAALENVLAWLSTRPAGPVFPGVQIRVNAGADHEIAAIRALGVDVGLRIPKVEDALGIDRVAPLAGTLPVTALIESARGLENAARIASHPAVTALALGEADLASDLGTREAAVIDMARLRLLVAARAAGLPAPMLSAYTDIRDLTQTDAKKPPNSANVHTAALLHRSFLKIGRLREEALLVRASVNFEFDGEIGI